MLPVALGIIPTLAAKEFPTKVSSIGFAATRWLEFWAILALSTARSVVAYSYWIEFGMIMSLVLPISEA
jgi:hypothetical protein